MFKITTHEPFLEINFRLF